jgi:hypothetical protein
MDGLVQPKAQEARQKAGRSRWLAGLLTGLLIVAAVSVSGLYALRISCEVEAVSQSSTFLDIQLKTYDQVAQVAATASRSAPDHPVNTLKQILMDTQQVSVPRCMQTAKTELVNYMGTIILAFQAYRAGETDAAVLDLIRQSDAQYRDFRAELRAVNECAPYCLP